MDEQRLIDATSLKVLFKHEYRHNKQFKQSSVYKAWQGAIQLLYDQPTIDPESLPIVRQLREELEKVTAERDAAVKDVKDLVLGEIKACSYCKHNDPENFDCMTEGFGYCGNWEWRGPQKEE